jgi:hypothetical protein
MKTKIFKLLKIFLWISGVFALSICLYLGYVFSKFNQDIDYEILNEVAKEIKKSKQLDARVLSMYDRVYDGASKNSSIKHAWKKLWGKKIECPCYMVTTRLPIHMNKRKKFTENSYAIATRLETKVSQMDCLNFLFEKFDYLYDAIGIEEAARIYFKKPMNELTDDELIGLIVMHENPSLFNPKRKKERFDKRVNEAKNKK